MEYCLGVCVVGEMCELKVEWCFPEIQARFTYVMDTVLLHSTVSSITSSLVILLRRIIRYRYFIGNVQVIPTVKTLDYSFISG